MSAETFLDGRVTLYLGDSRDVLQTLPTASIHAAIMDPPYALVSIVKRFGAEGAAPAKGDVYGRASVGFMGQQWDTGETAFAVEFWREVLRVLKPGSHLVAFGGTRTYHRLAVAIEDAGFEIRDSILDMVASDTAAMAFLASLDDAQRAAFARCLDDSRFGGLLAWVYGSGFPKSHSVAKQIEAGLGWFDEDERAAGMCSHAAAYHEHLGGALKPAFEPIILARKPLEGTLSGNVLVHGTGAINIDGCRIETDDPVVTFDRVPGDRAHDQYRMGTGEARSTIIRGRWPANVVHDRSREVVASFPTEAGASAPVRGTEASSVSAGIYGDRARIPGTFFDDQGSAARFFYSSKASAQDRVGSRHPTVKPLDLMQWLVRLVTPKGGVVLDAFAGTGTTGEAAWREGMRAVLIEREPRYAEDIRRRLRLANRPAERAAVAKAKGRVADDHGPLFSGSEVA